MYLGLPELAPITIDNKFLLPAEYSFKIAQSQGTFQEFAYLKH